MNEKKPIEFFVNKIHCGDMSNVLKQIPDNSVDCIVTDPPYGYSFMGKDWDKAVPPVEAWRECLRILKDGAFMFVMSAPRQDVLSQMIVRLAQAGFETGFTSIYWTYACLSEDTEVLTKYGWMNWELLCKTKRFISHKLHILIYDTIDGTYKWEVPNKWNYYSVKDTMFRIKSNYTDQFISRGHRIVIEREGKILFRTPEELEKERLETVNVPYLENMSLLRKNIYNATSMATKRRKLWNLLFNFLSSKNKYQKISSCFWKTHTQDVGKTKTKTKRGNDGRKELGLERRRNLLQNTWELCWSKVCSMSKRIFGYGTKGWLCHGTPFISGSTVRQTIIKDRSGSSYRPQSNEQCLREFDIISEQSNSQTLRKQKSYKTTLATITKEHYEGLVFCPTVSTGCFVARRHGKIFLTGNSGFPKSMNISLAIDKQECKKQLTKKLGRKPTKEEFEEAWKTFREVIGKTKRHNGRVFGEGVGDEQYGTYKGGIPNLTFPSSEEAKQLDGSYGGFQPKPALEVIIVCMKPLSEKTYVDQALKSGKGVTWLDDCRIPTSENLGGGAYAKNPEGRSDESEWKEGSGFKEGGAGKFKQPEGRFPANLLVSDDVLNDGTISKSVCSKRGGARNKGDADFHDYNYEELETKNYECGYADSGSFSRYFDLDKWFEKTFENLPEAVKKTFPFLICPKASKSERDKGLEDIEPQQVDKTRIDPTKIGCNNPRNRGGKKRINFHPTVKPIKLMSYLITLGSREEDVVLDPFVGSGTTCISAKILNRKWIGIDNNLEYCQIASARLENCEVVKHEQNLYEQYSKDMQEQSQGLIETKNEIIQTKDICPKCGTKMFKGKRGYYCPKVDCDGRIEK